MSYPANVNPSGAVLNLTQRITSVTACETEPRFDNLYAICFFRQAFCSLSAVRVNNENPSPGGSLSPHTL